MDDGTQEQLQVSFPASPTFTRIGRVAVAGLALRLGADISIVEQLRKAVDAAVSALHGSGRISVHATWQPSELLITLANPEADITDRDRLTDELTPLVTKAAVERSQVELLLTTA